MSEGHTNDPLHGITLKMIVEQLVDRHGFEELARRTRIVCFENKPTINSSLKMLRKTDWARAKVERLYLADLKKKRRTERRAAERAAALTRSEAEPAEPSIVSEVLAPGLGTEPKD